MPKELLTSEVTLVGQELESSGFFEASAAARRVIAVSCYCKTDHVVLKSLKCFIELK